MMQPSKWGEGSGGAGRWLGVDGGRWQGIGAKYRTLGLCGDFVQYPGRNGRWDWLQRPIAAGNWERNSLCHLVFHTSRARHLPKLCRLVFTTTPERLSEVRESVQDGTVLNGQSKELLSGKGYGKCTLRPLQRRSRSLGTQMTLPHPSLPPPIRQRVLMESSTAQAPKLRMRYSERPFKAAEVDWDRNGGQCHQDAAGYR